MLINSFRAKRYILVIYRISKRTANTGAIFCYNVSVFKLLEKNFFLTKSLVHKPSGLKVLGRILRIRP
jgi:hypothetical protein